MDVEAMSSEAAYALGVSLLAQGRYDEGFAYYAARWKCPQLTLSVPLPLIRRWRGEELSGRRLMVWPEQGLGDAIMMSRFAFALGRAGVSVELAARGALARLFKGHPGVSVCDLGGSFEAKDLDFIATDFEIAAAFLRRGKLHAGAYLTGEAAFPKPGCIGIITRGNPRHPDDAHRSLPPDMAERLLSLPGAVSLHPDDTGAADFQATADIISGLDLVIAVDTSVAHLAGAMGKPVWILLSRAATDWRWGPSGTTTPWYPSARLLHQPRPGDWGSVLVEIEAALKPVKP